MRKILAAALAVWLGLLGAASAQDTSCSSTLNLQNILNGIATNTPVIPASITPRSIRDAVCSIWFEANNVIAAGALTGAETLVILKANVPSQTTVQTIANLATSGSVQSFNGRVGVVVLTSLDVTNALGFTPLGTTSALKLPMRRITAGASDTAGANDYAIAWNKTVGSASAQTIPACAAGISGQLYSIIDEKGDANANPITVTPSAGTVVNTTAFIINSNLMSVTFVCDGASTNWAVN